MLYAKIDAMLGQRSRVVWAACLCVFAAFALPACNNPPKPVAVPSMMRDVKAFAAHPDDTTFEQLHVDMFSGILSMSATTGIVDVLATERVPPQVRSATLEDLAMKDLEGAIARVRLLNIAAQRDRTVASRGMVSRTANLCWTLLALRPASVIDAKAIDLSGMDLRSNAAFVGQRMNLASTIFNRAELNGGTWRSSVLSGASFKNTVTTGRLVCVNCVWGTVIGTFSLSGDRWTP
jgi:hypothetical protein